MKRHANDPAASHPIVATSAGAVRGSVRDGVVRFRGIRYAESTAGPNRFRPPQPLVGWSGVRDALTQGPACPQPPVTRPVSRFDRTAGTFAEWFDEDCLSLNVWTPGLDAARRPVLVWFHGGWFAFGSGNEPAFDGTRLAGRQDVVVVTVTHRLGIFGHLALDGFAAGDFRSSGNAGTLDMVAALEWVRDNVAGFGGDPGNVTVFGESGGASKVCVLLGTPKATGLFHRAVVQSGPLLRALQPDRAALTTRAILAALSMTTVDELQGASTTQLLAAQVAALGGPLGGVYGDGPRLCPVVDGVVLPDHPFDPVASACSTGVPLLIGTVKDETSTMASAVPGLWDMAPEDQVAMLTDGFFGHELDDLLPAYAGTRPDATPLVRFLAASSDQLRVGSITIAERHAAAEGAAPVFMYRMDYETPVLGGRLGAMHTLDVGFVFDNVHLSSAYPDDGSAHAMAKRMSGSWAAFARTGDPNNAMVPAWPPYDVDRRATMVFDEDTRVVDDPDGEERLAWAGRPGGL